MRVLVVSPKADERLRLAGALLGRPDVEIVEATSAVEAHQLTSERTFDVLVIDGDMRPEGGQSLLYEIRARAEYRGEPAPPAIMLMDREQDRWISGWAGAADVMLKPVDSFDVAERVLELMRDTGGAVPVGDEEGTAGEPLAMDEPSEFQGRSAPAAEGSPSAT
ncbi:MAG TPA: hypothetical protein VHF25_14170 [Nitriliruptorales bacterium]|nr:hypothetical protein [Nitriliruptorales bacterium]